MLKLEVDGGHTKSEFQGKLDLLCAELVVGINQLYRDIERSDPDAAEAFRSIMTALVTDEESPLWPAKHSGSGTSVCIVQPQEDE